MEVGDKVKYVGTTWDDVYEGFVFKVLNLWGNDACVVEFDQVDDAGVKYMLPCYVNELEYVGETK